MKNFIYKKHFLVFLIFLLLNFKICYSNTFNTLIENSKGKKVFFHAWGGSSQVNDYLRWVSKNVKKKYNIDLEHVKLLDTSDAIDQIVSEKLSGNISNGSVDLVWVNGENFSFMKKNNLLLKKNWVEKLPSFKFIDTVKTPGILYDFGIKTDGLEAPWGKSQLVFGYDSNLINELPLDAKNLLSWIKKYPNKFTYPMPPDFTGTTFLKQILLETSTTPEKFYHPPNLNTKDNLLKPLWNWLDEAHPFMWRNGNSFPNNHSKLTQLLGDKEIFISFSLNPGEFLNGISNGYVPDTVKPYIHKEGTISNFHFVAIPFNSRSIDAAKVVVNYLMSPEAQIEKSDPNVWGDMMVISENKINGEFKNFNTKLSFTKSLLEPHPEWVSLIENGWKKRYQN